MSKSIIRAACGLLILTIVIAGLAGCSNEIAEMAEPDYANQMTETTAQGMSNCDYDVFTYYLSAEAKAAISEADFETGCPEIKNIIGDYIDKEYQETSDYNGYVLVKYKANYSEEPDGVIISVYFEETDGEMYIAGFALDSPKLREAAAAAAAAGE